ncbi:hypothetical protein DFH29DRAFT_878530 [Suillus ampliporus]|nr:hypothetical protein DFH29DRAFT_878530 [Suillus ampliporus]
MLNLAGTLVNAAKALGVSTNRNAQNARNWLIILTLVAAAVCDLVITIGLLYFLQRERRRTKVHQTHSITDCLTLWAIETGLATSMSAVLAIAFSSGRPFMTFWLTICSWPHESLYSGGSTRARADADIGSIAVRLPAFKILASPSFRFL